MLALPLNGFAPLEKVVPPAPVITTIAPASIVIHVERIVVTGRTPILGKVPTAIQISTLRVW